MTSDFAATSVPTFTLPRKGVTTFPFKKWEGHSPAFPLNLSTASVGVRQTASGVCEVTGGPESWEVVYFTNFMVKLLKWTASLKSILESSIIMSKFCQNVSSKVADKHYRKHTFCYAAASPSAAATARVNIVSILEPVERLLHMDALDSSTLVVLAAWCSG